MLMTLTLTAEPPPLAIDAYGVVRIGKTRVTLDTVVTVFKQGATPEEIVQQLPSLDLANVSAVVGFYLKHVEDVETYLRQRRQKAAEVRQRNEARFNRQDLRDRLLARRALG